MVDAVEIEVDGPQNEQLRFRPLQRSIRGRFDMARLNEPMSATRAKEWPMPIPSQRLGIDPDGSGYIAEPLHEAEYAPLREKIERGGMRLEEEVQHFEGIHLPSWLYWMARAVECGLARVTKGNLPKAEDVQGEPRKNFIMAPPEPGPTDKLTAAIERQNELFEKLIAKLAEK